MVTLGIENELRDYQKEPTPENLVRVVREIVRTLEKLDDSKLDDDNYRDCGCC